MRLRVFTTSAWMMKQNLLIFDDWFDFADYVKQENLAGRSVTIAKWEYINAV